MDKLAKSKLIAFVGVTDMDMARKFYADVLGLHVKDSGVGFLVLDAHGTLLRLTQIENLINVEYTVVGWQVHSIQDVAETLAGRGVIFQTFDGIDQDARGIWLAPNGDRVAWFLDPDSNILSITEFSASAASS
jgi:catechol 2,3-dioxygenase-like lactoylglutathione lyase family enzyme